MNENDIDTLFNQLVNQQFAARVLGIDKQTINNYRRRPVTLGTKLEVLFKADKLRLKDDWDE